jgi:hypothetical protein
MGTSVLLRRTFQEQVKSSAERMCYIRQVCEFMSVVGRDFAKEKREQAFTSSVH